MMKNCGVCSRREGRNDTATSVINTLQKINTILQNNCVGRIKVYRMMQCKNLSSKPKPKTMHKVLWSK